MQKSDASSSFWRKLSLRRRKESDFDDVTSRADELLSSLEAAQAGMRDLIKHNAELTKTFAEQLKNLAADFERRSDDDRSTMDARFEDLQKAIDQKLCGIRREVDQIAEKAVDVVCKQSDLLKQEQAVVAEKLDRTYGAVANVDGSMAGIRNHMAEQHQIQRRYQEGYDFQVLKNFVRQIIQMLANIDRRIGMTGEGESRRDLEYLRNGLILLLSKSGVEQIVPAVGIEYSDRLRQMAEVVGHVDAPTPALAGRIAAVVQPGYLYNFTADGEQSHCIQQAKITLFQMSLLDATPRPVPGPPKGNEADDKADEIDGEEETGVLL